MLTIAESEDINMKEKKLTRYPSIDKPWLKYYSDEATNVSLSEGSIYEYLWKNNQNHLGDTAIISFGKEITYGTLFQNIDKAANAFIALGVKSGDIVSILSLNTPETIYLIYALNKIGAIASMEPAIQSNQQLASSLQQTGTNILAILDIFCDRYLSVLEKFLLQKVIVLNVAGPTSIIDDKPNGKYCTYEQFLSNAHSLEKVTLHDGLRNAPAVIVQTSGTTAIPKKVILTNENINSVTLQYRVANFKFVRGETFLEIVPPYLSVGFTLQMHTPLCLGLKSIASLDPDPIKIAELFAACNPNNFMGGVAHVKEIATNPITQNMDLSGLRNFAVGGESISPEERDKINAYLSIHKASIKLITGYGMTELSSSVITEQQDVENSKSIGIPLSKVVVKAVDMDTEMELPYQEIGELMVQSPSMMREYMNNPDETARTISIDSNGGRWLHTGDLGYIDEEGFVYIVGRIKKIFQTLDIESHQIFKLYPDYIESEINNCPLVNRCAVITVQDATRLQVPIAFLTLKEMFPNAKSIIESYLKDRLASYNMPEKYIIIDQIPLLASGKIDYRALEEKYLNKTNISSRTD